MSRFIAAAVLAAGVLLLPGSTAHAGLLILAGPTDTVAVAPGGLVTLDLVLRGPSPAFNAFDLDVRFDPTRLTSTPMSPISLQRGALMTSACTLNPPFHQFTSTPDSLVCTMVILCAGVSVTGPGTLYHVRFTAASTNAWTTVTFGAGTAFYLGGPVVDTLVRLPIVVKIGSPVLAVGDPTARVHAPELEPVRPNPGRTPITLGVVFRLPRADTAELSLLDAQGRRVASLPGGPREPGEQRALLPLPRLAPGRYTLVLRTGRGEVRTQPWVVLR